MLQIILVFKTEGDLFMAEEKIGKEAVKHIVI